MSHKWFFFSDFPKKSRITTCTWATRPVSYYNVHMSHSPSLVLQRAHDHSPSFVLQRAHEPLAVLYYNVHMSYSPSLVLQRAHEPLVQSRITGCTRATRPVSYCNVHMTTRPVSYYNVHMSHSLSLVLQRAHEPLAQSRITTCTWATRPVSHYNVHTSHSPSLPLFYQPNYWLRVHRICSRSFTRSKYIFQPLSLRTFVHKSKCQGTVSCTIVFKYLKMKQTRQNILNFIIFLVRWVVLCIVLFCALCCFVYCVVLCIICV